MTGTDWRDYGDEHPRELALSNGMLAICTLVAGTALALSFLLPQ